MECPNLETLCGDVYRIAFDEAYNPRHKREKDPWAMKLEFRGGEIVPWGYGILAVGVEGRAPLRRTLAGMGLRLVQDGDREQTWVFPVTQLEEILKIVKPSKKRRCHLSPGRLKEAGERLRRAVKSNALTA